VIFGLETEVSQLKAQIMTQGERFGVLENFVESAAGLKANGYPPELYLNMTITKFEHIEALMETLNTYAPQLQFARRRDEDR
jgi:hypothetical protein